jgi:hypothetical protein
VLTTTDLTSRSHTSRLLLAGGIVAGPLFAVVAAAQVLTREAFDLSRHPLSLLSLGDLGWLQVGNFVVTGLLTVASAAGMRGTLAPGPARFWAPLLYGAFGVGLVAGGLFTTDPVPGFPAGTPAASSVAQAATWHAAVHDVAAGIALDAGLLASLVLARRFHRSGRRGWATYSLVTSLAGLALSWWPSAEGISVRLAVTVVLLLVWGSAVAAVLSRRRGV